MTPTLLIEMLLGAVALLGTLWATTTAISTWVWRRHVSQSDDVRSRVELLERRGERADAEFLALRNEVGRIPTLEAIREVIREEIDRAWRDR